MDDAEFEIQKNRVKSLVDWWVPNLNLGWVDLDIEYIRDGFSPNGEPDPDTVAVTSASWRYCKARISWNMHAVVRQSDAELEWILLHEVQHVFLNETREKGRDWLDHEERVASVLATAFIKVRDELVKPDP